MHVPVDLNYSKTSQCGVCKVCGFEWKNLTFAEHDIKNGNLGHNPPLAQVRGGY